MLPVDKHRHGEVRVDGCDVLHGSDSVEDVVLELELLLRQDNAHLAREDGAEIVVELAHVPPLPGKLNPRLPAERPARAIDPATAS